MPGTTVQALARNTRPPADEIPEGVLGKHDSAAQEQVPDGQAKQHTRPL